MGRISAAAFVGHVPTIMLPEPVRRAIGGGDDTSLIAGFDSVRTALDEGGVDTLVIFDTHWFTTTEHIVGGQDHYRGTFTSEELPTLISDLAYDYPGAPELARLVEKVAQGRGVRCLNATNPHLIPHYPTLNILRYLHRGEGVMSVGICQTAQPHNFLDLGAALADAVAESDATVGLLASGGMSHRFWPLDEAMAHGGYSPDNVITPEARSFDERILGLWAEGRHRDVIDLSSEYAGHSPEGFFGHYLMMVGALGGADCRAPGRQVSAYENALGTGQVHVVFDLPASA